jgi:ketose-bisphosphate aldolase
MLVTLPDLVADARAHGWALGAFNTYNLEITGAIIAAAEEVRAPVIVQTGAGALRGPARTALPALALALARVASVPVAVHLDHCTDLATIEHCLALGYTSVMVDGSSQAYPANVTLTRQAVALGHAAGVTVEAELTGTAGDEDNAAHPGGRPRAFTDPEQAARFARETGVDLLAVAIGNVHGFYRGEPRLDFALLQELAREVPLPLVLHGASGLPDEALRRAVSEGIAKVNFNTELRAAYMAALSTGLPGAQHGLDVVALMAQGMAAVQQVVREKLSLLGATGRA